MKWLASPCFSTLWKLKEIPTVDAAAIQTNVLTLPWFFNPGHQERLLMAFKSHYMGPVCRKGDGEPYTLPYIKFVEKKKKHREEGWVEFEKIMGSVAA
jgi:hypothetical protein